jgi:hypothetical protein
MTKNTIEAMQTCANLLLCAVNQMAAQADQLSVLQIKNPESNYAFEVDRQLVKQNLLNLWRLGGFDADSSRDVNDAGKPQDRFAAKQNLSAAGAKDKKLLPFQQIEAAKAGEFRKVM